MKATWKKTYSGPGYPTLPRFEEIKISDPAEFHEWGPPRNGKKALAESQKYYGELFDEFFRRLVRIAHVRLFGEKTVVDHVYEQSPPAIEILPYQSKIIAALDTDQPIQLHHWSRRRGFQRAGTCKHAVMLISDDGETGRCEDCGFVEQQPQFNEACHRCGHEIDPMTCHCGARMVGDGHEGHNPVPMGCVCHYVNRPQIDLSEPPL